MWRSLSNTGGGAGGGGGGLPVLGETRATPAENKEGKADKEIEVVPKREEGSGKRGSITAMLSTIVTAGAATATAALAPKVPESWPNVAFKEAIAQEGVGHLEVLEYLLEVEGARKGGRLAVGPRDCGVSKERLEEMRGSVMMWKIPLVELSAWFLEVEE
ncbi:hypothetical protein HK101_004286 [Irineochytrium annulatum]|nr:hypothetical protein HK101_004286 [Irineochytrium annulatum]